MSTVDPAAPGGLAPARVARPNRPPVPVTADELARGLAGGEFTAHFQPKIEMATRRLVGTEALMRWNHPSHGLLAAGAFLALAQQSGLLEPLTDAVLSSAIAACAGWRRQGLSLNVAVNLPVDCLANHDLPSRIADVMQRHGLDAECLILEVTEDGWLQQQPVAREVLTRLRMRGHGLSIDDFGTGHSTFQQLLHAPFNELKIDQSFVRHAADDEESAIALAASIDMAHRLKLQVVAEGIETGAQWRRLAGLGCDLAQGYYVAPAMAFERIVGWKTEWDRRLARRI